MKERPILFSGPMVKAILEGRKTQTRRVVKGYHGVFGLRRFGEEWLPIIDGNAVLGDIQSRYRCPYGVPGDRLWVKETWTNISYELSPENACILYRVDGESKPIELPWRPSIFMPRWASRITLEITDVRVQRLGEISAQDCEAEGIRVLEGERVCHANQTKLDDAIYLDAYQRLWDSINAKRGFGWDANPWVWVITFKQLT